jgi:hypothetical protein
MDENPYQSPKAASLLVSPASVSPWKAAARWATCWAIIGAFVAGPLIVVVVSMALTHPHRPLGYALIELLVVAGVIPVLALTGAFIGFAFRALLNWLR